MEKILVKDINKIDLKGRVIAFPTDTVYGVGCIIDDEIAINKIYELKHRDYSKPLAVLAPNNNIDKYVKDISKEAHSLMEKYWPGALTIIFNKSSLIPPLVTSNMESVGLRVPNSEIALKVLNQFGLMCTTSINLSGEDSINNIKEIEEKFGDFIDYLVIDEASLSKVASTVVDARSSNLKVLRQGSIVIN